MKRSHICICIVCSLMSSACGNGNSAIATSVTILPHGGMALTDCNGIRINDLTYDLLTFAGERVIACSDARYSLLDLHGKTISDGEYDFMEKGLDGCVIAQRGDKYHLIDRSGHISSAYDTFDNCFNGTAIVSRNGKYGIVGLDGRMLIAARYDSIAYHTDALALSVSADTVSLITSGGKTMGSQIVHKAAERVEANGEELFAAMFDDYLITQTSESAAWDTILDNYETLAKYYRQALNAVEADGALSAEQMNALSELTSTIHERLGEVYNEPDPKRLRRYYEITNRIYTSQIE